MDDIMCVKKNIWCNVVLRKLAKERETKIKEMEICTGRRED